MSKPFVIIAGAPNAGKTSLYNHITGSNFRTVNYPGATVDYSIGETHAKFGEAVTVLDTPGTYSLFPKSLDEQVTASILFDDKAFSSRAALLVIVVDATQLRRHLLIVEQARQAGFRIVVAITMIDLLARQGLHLDTEILGNALGHPVFPVNGVDGTGAGRLLSALRATLQESPKEICRPEPWNMEQHFQFSMKTQRVYERGISKTGASTRKDPAVVSRKIDSILLHPVFGLSIFALIMTGMFSAIFWMAAPLMDLVDGIFAWGAERLLSLAPESLVVQFVANGIVSSLGAVLVFVPQIVILFFLLGLLEDTGYLARAATLVDKPLSKLGLNGRSFVPLLSGYACAIPAMMAARTISNRREKFITLFIVPLASCSARLPVYALLLSFLFAGEAPWKAGLSMAAIYMGSLVLALAMAALLNRFITQKEPSLFMMELPFYRKPGIRSVLRGVWARTYGYITRAAPVIVVLSMIMWVGVNFPRQNGEAHLEQSYLAQAGRVLEPVMEPMGGDWRTGVSLLSAFAAREVFVSSLAVILNVTSSADEEAEESSIIAKMKQATNSRGEPLFTPSSAVGLIVFFVIALQCLTTVGVARREFGNWSAPIAQLVLFNLAGYGLAVAAVQFVRLFAA